MFMYHDTHKSPSQQKSGMTELGKDLDQQNPRLHQQMTDQTSVNTILEAETRDWGGGRR